MERRMEHKSELVDEAPDVDGTTLMLGLVNDFFHNNAKRERRKYQSIWLAGRRRRQARTSRQYLLVDKQYLIPKK